MAHCFLLYQVLHITVKRGLICAKSVPSVFASSMTLPFTKETCTRNLYSSRTISIPQQCVLQCWRISRSPQSYPNDWKNISTLRWSTLLKAFIFLAASSSCSRRLVICLCISKGQTSSVSKMFSNLDTIQDAVSVRCLLINSELKVLKHVSYFCWNYRSYLKYMLSCCSLAIILGKGLTHTIACVAGSENWIHCKLAPNIE